MERPLWFEGILALLVGVRSCQRDTIAKMIAAECLAGSVTITAMARAASIPFRQSPRTLHKAFDRALSSESIDPMSLYRELFLRVVGSQRRVVIAVDWLSLRRDTMRVLLASVTDSDGRAWLVLALSIPTSQRKRRQREIETKMIAAVATLKPTRCAVILLADRGFDGASFRADVRAAKLHYVIRVRGNLQAFWDGKKYTTRKLACSRGTGTIHRDGVALTAKKDAVGAFVSCWDEKSKGPWLLIIDLPDCGDEILALCKLRSRIEESIRDIKNLRLGLGLEEVRIGDPRRWSVLLAVTLVSYWVIRRCGRIARERGLARCFSTSGGQPNATLHLSWNFPRQRLDQHPLRSPRNHANRRFAARRVRGWVRVQRPSIESLGYIAPQLVAPINTVTNAMLVLIRTPVTTMIAREQMERLRHPSHMRRPRSVVAKHAAPCL